MPRLFRRHSVIVSYPVNCLTRFVACAPVSTYRQCIAIYVWQDFKYGQCLFRYFRSHHTTRLNCLLTDFSYPIRKFSNDTFNFAVLEFWRFGILTSWRDMQYHRRRSQIGESGFQPRFTCFTMLSEKLYFTIVKLFLHTSKFSFTNLICQMFLCRVY